MSWDDEIDISIQEYKDLKDEMLKNLKMERIVKKGTLYTKRFKLKEHKYTLNCSIKIKDDLYFIVLSISQSKINNIKISSPEYSKEVYVEKFLEILDMCFDSLINMTVYKQLCLGCFKAFDKQNDNILCDFCNPN